MRTLLTTVVCALALAAMPGPSHASFVTDTHDTPESTTISHGAPVPVDHTWDCGPQLAIGLGPPHGDMPGCGPATHTLGAPGFIQIGLNGDSGTPIPPHGSLSAELTGDGGAHIVFTCTWIMGEFVGCALVTNEGWPEVGETFDVWCYSGTGKVGPWNGCTVTHT